MTSPLKKLLVLGALMWVAPLGAEPRDRADRSSSHDEAGCPYERAEAMRAAQVDSLMLGRHAQSAALLP